MYLPYYFITLTKFNYINRDFTMNFHILHLYTLLRFKKLKHVYKALVYAIYIDIS